MESLLGVNHGVLVSYSVIFLSSVDLYFSFEKIKKPLKAEEASL
jgi:hypothetical protein